MSLIVVNMVVLEYETRFSPQPMSLQFMEYFPFILLLVACSHRELEMESQVFRPMKATVVSFDKRYEDTKFYVSLHVVI